MKKKPAFTFRKAVFAFHLWAGLTLGLYFALLGLTGSILVFRNELEDACFPEFVHVAAPANTRPLPATDMLSALRKQFPSLKDSELAALEFPRHPGGAYGAYVNVDDNRLLVTLDPYHGHIISRFDQNTHWVAFLGNLHMYLLLEAKGLLINTYGGIVIALMLGSGLWLWWPKLWTQVKARVTVKRGSSFKRLMNDLHNVFGIYGFVFLIMASLTGAVFGIWEATEATAYKLTETVKDTAEPQKVNHITAPFLPIERLVAIAEKTVPDARIASITYPTKPDQPFTAWKVTEQGQMLYANLAIDPYTGVVLDAHDSRNEPLGGQIMRWIQMLHFGWWGNWWSKIPYAILGLLPLGLYVTGIVRWVLRRKALTMANRR